MKQNKNSKDLFADLALPKKVLASVKDIPANTKKEKLPKPLVRYLEKIIDDIGWDYGQQQAKVFAPLFKRASETFKGNSFVEEDRHAPGCDKNSSLNFFSPSPSRAGRSLQTATSASSSVRSEIFVELPPAKFSSPVGAKYVAPDGA